MQTLNYILERFDLSYDGESRLPVEIPNMGRDNLPALFNELGFKVGVEVGVESGLYSHILLNGMPELTLYSVDPWKSYRAYRDHTRQEKLDRFYEEAKAALAPYGERSKIIRAYSMDAVNQFKDDSLDFVYIDGNHSFVHVAQDINYWQKKVKRGGILCGHDYKKHPVGVNIHVKQVVDGFTDAYGIRPWFVIGRMAKKEGEIRDGSRSWMWVRT